MSFVGQEAQSLPTTQRINEGTAMYKCIGLIAALGLLGATSLTPVAAAPTANSGLTTVSVDDFSAAKHMKKQEKRRKQRSKEGHENEIGHIMDQRS